MTIDHKAQDVESILPSIRPFVSRQQLAAMIRACNGEEGNFFRGRMVRLAAELAAMPVTYGQDGLGMDAVAHLHYLTAGSDWYITERDMELGTGLQDFGYAILNGDDEMAELGYISIAELVAHGAELDWYFGLQTISSIKDGRCRRLALASGPGYGATSCSDTGSISL